MKAYNEIVDELRSLGAQKHVLRCRETRSLPKILHKDENIVAFVYGVFENGANALMIGTNKRLLYVNKTPGNIVVDDIPYDMVASVEFHSGVMWGKVTLFARSRTYTFTYVKKAYIEPFVSVVEDLMHERRPHPTDI